MSDYSLYSWRQYNKHQLSFMLFSYLFISVCQAKQRCLVECSLPRIGGPVKSDILEKFGLLSFSMLQIQWEINLQQQETSGDFCKKKTRPRFRLYLLIRFLPALQDLDLNGSTPFYTMWGWHFLGYTLDLVRIT